MPPESPAVLRNTVTVRCQECGRQHRLERGEFDTRCTIWLVCHGCETPLGARFDDEPADYHNPKCLEPLPAPAVSAPEWWGFV
jgi:hypothetical protein